MIITRLILKNWRNFREIDVSMGERTYLLGPNAAGKSNFLDVFRFLRDVSKAKGGGLQKAVQDRGGIPKLRCLHARRDPEVLIEVHLAESSESKTAWRYILAFKPEGKGAQRTLISREEVWKGRERLFSRPNSLDRSDEARLTQTNLEQIQANANFREIVSFFSETTYLHLVPQLLKHSDIIGGRRLEDDPFGQGFLERIAMASDRIRISRLKKIEKALSIAVPQFKQLKHVRDKNDGRPHLEARYAHYRPKAGWQREDQFSDGTLRLIGLLWSLLEGDSLLLLEEPELSLNDAIVKKIPLMLHRMQKESKKRGRQVILSTHSEALLSNPGIDARGVLLLTPSAEGTKVREISPEETSAIKAGLTIAEVMLPKARPSDSDQLGLW